jgi:RES domain-containing protein
VPRLVFARQTPPFRRALELPDTAPRGGRYNEAGAPAPLYASSSPAAAMAELVRQSPDAVFASSDLRRLSTLRLPPGPFFDLTSEAIQFEKGVTRADLIGDDVTRTRRIAREVADIGHYVGLLAPSAARDEDVTAVVFQPYVTSVELVDERLVRIVDFI